MGRERAAPAASAGEHEAYRARVDAVFRAHAIDQAYDRVREIERNTVTPAMKRIEAEDPERRLAGLEHSLKGKDRLTEKVDKMVNELGHSVDQAIGLVKDSIRYTFCYPEARYSDGVDADCDRLQDAGYRLVDRENSWTAEQYKGINSRWREPESGQLFLRDHRGRGQPDRRAHPPYRRRWRLIGSLLDNTSTLSSDTERVFLYY